MPDKYDTKNYGQGVANLQGAMGANGQSFTENPSLKAVFAGRTGIQDVEETLAQYGTVQNAPQWLQPQFNQLKAMFGESSTGSGKLSIGIGGSGKDCNNQQVVGASGLSGAEYQYTQLDAVLNQYQVAYAKAIASGQASRLSYYDASAAPGTPPPPGADFSISYQAQSYYV